MIRVGGPVDSFNVSFVLYGDDLEPDAVTRRLGVQPTSAAQKGYRKRPEYAPLPRGHWCLSQEGRAPGDPARVLAGLLDRLPQGAEIWAELGQTFEIQVRLGIFLEEWNRGFELPGEIVKRLAAVGAMLVFDIYANDDD